MFEVSVLGYSEPFIFNLIQSGIRILTKMFMLIQSGTYHSGNNLGLRTICENSPSFVYTYLKCTFNFSHHWYETNNVIFEIWVHSVLFYRYLWWWSGTICIRSKQVCERECNVIFPTGLYSNVWIHKKNYTNILE